jgi:hypothetical protein
MKARLASLAVGWIALALSGATLSMALLPAPAQTQDAQHAGAQAAGGQRTEADLRQLLAGTWHLTIPEATARQRIDQAIERTVNEMNFFLQGVTRDQLRQQTPLNRRLDIDFPADGRITVVFDQRFTYTTRPGIAQPFTLPDGMSLDVTQHFRGGHLEQYFGHFFG